MGYFSQGATTEEETLARAQRRHKAEQERARRSKTAIEEMRKTSWGINIPRPPRAPKVISLGPPPSSTKPSPFDRTPPDHLDRVDPEYSAPEVHEPPAAAEVAPAVEKAKDMARGLMGRPLVLGGVALGVYFLFFRRRR